MPDVTKHQVMELSNSQSVKTVGARGECGTGSTEEKAKGWKRHIVVDTMGNLLSIVVRAANIHDTKSRIHCAKQAIETYPAIKKFCADAKYTGTFVVEVRDKLCRDADISKKIRPHQ